MPTALVHQHDTTSYVIPEAEKPSLVKLLVKPPGKCGPHIFRHARAVEMLRTSVPQKVIGDLLGHRSTASTAPYLKLATEDLRAIALDVPGAEGLA